MGTIEMFCQIPIYISQIQEMKKIINKKFVEDWRCYAEKLKRVLNSKEKLASDQHLRDKEIYRQMDILRRQQEMDQDRYISLTAEIKFMREEAFSSAEDRKLLSLQLTQAEKNLYLQMIIWNLVEEKLMNLRIL